MSLDRWDLRESDPSPLTRRYQCLRRGRWSLPRVRARNLVSTFFDSRLLDHTLPPFPSEWVGSDPDSTGVVKERHKLKRTPTYGREPGRSLPPSRGGPKFLRGHGSYYLGNSWSDQPSRGHRRCRRPHRPGTEDHENTICVPPRPTPTVWTE